MDVTSFAQGNSKWMAQDDVPVSGVDLAIATVEEDIVGDDEKLVCYFTGNQFKPLVLNMTNLRILISLFGKESEKWVGRIVNVYQDPTISFGGQVTGGTRIRMPVGEMGRAQVYEAEQKATAASMQGVANDDIPF